MFPHNREVPDDILQELSGILLHWGIGASGPISIKHRDSLATPDCMTSSTSTAGYPEPEFSKLLGYVGQIKQVGGKHGFSACVVGKPSAHFPLSFPHGFLRSLNEFLR